MPGLWNMLYKNLFCPEETSFLASITKHLLNRTAGALYEYFSVYDKGARDCAPSDCMN